jgi:hypothetical protein
MQIKFLVSYEMYTKLKRKAVERDTDIDIDSVEFHIHKSFPVEVPCRGCKGMGHPPAYPDRLCLMCEGDKVLVLHGVKMEGDLFTPLLSRKETVQSEEKENSDG